MRTTTATPAALAAEIAATDTLELFNQLVALLARTGAPRPWADARIRLTVLELRQRALIAQLAS